VGANIAVKLPATSADSTSSKTALPKASPRRSPSASLFPKPSPSANGIVPASVRAETQGITPGKCFAVLMIGRLDDYLREVAQDNQASVSESDIRQAGLAVTSARTQSTASASMTPSCSSRLRGDYHLTELAGADLIMSIHPSWQGPFVSRDFPFEPRIECPIRRRSSIVSVRCRVIKAYEPDGMSPADFITYGPTQRTSRNSVKLDGSHGEFR